MNGPVTVAGGYACGMRNRLRALPVAALSALTALALGLAACGDSDGTDAAASGSATTEPAFGAGAGNEEVEGLNFTVDGTEYTCWSGGPSAVFCAGPGPWAPEGDAASTVMFDIRNQTTALLPGGTDLSTKNLADADGGTMDIAGITYDTTDPARMTFTHNELGTTGFIAATDYGWQ